MGWGAAPPNPEPRPLHRPPRSSAPFSRLWQAAVAALVVVAEQAAEFCRVMELSERCGVWGCPVSPPSPPILFSTGRHRRPSESPHAWPRAVVRGCSDSW